MTGSQTSLAELEHFFKGSLSGKLQGTNINKYSGNELNELLSPLIQKGQSLSHIYATRSKKIGLSRRTIYNYIDNCIFDVRNIDLPRKVRYKKWKKKPSEPVD